MIGGVELKPGPTSPSSSSHNADFYFETKHLGSSLEEFVVMEFENCTRGDVKTFIDIIEGTPISSQAVPMTPEKNVSTRKSRKRKSGIDDLWGTPVDVHGQVGQERVVQQDANGQD